MYGVVVVICYLGHVIWLSLISCRFAYDNGNLATKNIGWFTLEKNYNSTHFVIDW